jgi:hypothetical protein
MVPQPSPQTRRLIELVNDLAAGRIDVQTYYRLSANLEPPKPATISSAAQAVPVQRATKTSCTQRPDALRWVWGMVITAVTVIVLLAVVAPHLR